MNLLIACFSIILFLPQFLLAAPVHHELKVKLIPSQHRIEAVDRIILPAPVADRRITVIPALDGEARWLDERTCEVIYSGAINFPLLQVGVEYARGQKDTLGSIGPEGVYLDGGSGWYPHITRKPDERITFDLTVELPAGWDAVTQGTRIQHTLLDTGSVVRWVCQDPQSAIWLVAGRYKEYKKKFGSFEAMAFFRQPEKDLAGKYLQATAEYISMYEWLIGSYPYSKFALVENFWETGYGMPSFALLGPRVIRFPFIIDSSYPHEILHNWWGNSVYIDYRSGNWGEGLTAYLADHLIKEQKGLGAQHRLEALQKYSDYVLTGRDFPLTSFRSRHDSVTEAIGYGKSLMLFHMLRLRLGNEVFRKGLHGLFEKNVFHTADFEDVRSAFETAALQNLDVFFDQWVKRTGAPEIKLASAETLEERVGGYSLEVVLEQVQDGEPYVLEVPVAVTLMGTPQAELLKVPMNGVRASTSLSFPTRPVRVDVDPRFDLFRRLDRREMPPALTQVFGAQKKIIVLPSEASPGLLDSYRSLARALARAGPGKVEITLDTDLEDVPPDASAWLLGWENKLLPQIVPAFILYNVKVDVGTGVVELDDGASTTLDSAKHSVVLTARHPLTADLAVVWVGARNPAAHPGLARKLPHYHRYSYLAFTGDDPENVVKGRWPVVGSPLTGFPSGGSYPMGTLKERDPLAQRSESSLD